MFGVVGEIAGKLFGTDKAINNLLDKDEGLLVKAGSWIGNFNYTSEEKAEADAGTRQWGLRQLEALAPFKVVQRILAFAAAGFWIFVGVNVVVAIWIDALTRTTAMINGVLTVTGGTNVKADMMAFAMSNYVFWPVAIVFGLYFAGGVIPRGNDK